MTRARQGHAVAAGVVLLGAVAVAAGVAGAGPQTGGDRPTAGGLAATTDEFEPEQVVIELALQMDGSARWTVEHRVRLDDPADRSGFEQTRARLRENRSAFRAPFLRRVRAMATEAEEATGRTMVVENVSVRTTRRQLPREYGVVEYSFRWYGFAAADDRLRAGDALRGLFLDDNTKLLVTWPRETTLAEVAPGPDERRNRTVIWEGPAEFSRNEPRIVLESESNFDPGPSLPGPSDDVLVALLGLGVVAVTLVGVVAWHRDWFGGDVTGEEPVAGGETATAAGTGESRDPDGAGAATGDAAASGAVGPDGTSTEPPSDLLSNEERVLALLDERGGRVKQQAVVSEFGWSETKTSEVVSDLREADEIEVYRLGRENVLTLPDTGLGIDTGGDEE